MPMSGCRQGAVMVTCLDEAMPHGPWHIPSPVQAAKRQLNAGHIWQALQVGAKQKQISSDVKVYLH